MNEAESRLFSAALTALQRGDFREAEQAANRLLAVNPSHADGLHMLGIAQWQQGKQQVAIETVRRAIGIAPERALYHQSIGNMFAAMGDYDLAAQAFNEVVRLAPGQADAWNNLGVALRMRGLMAESIGALERALGIDPNNFDAMINLGMALRELGRDEEASELFRKALQLRPEHPVGLGNLGAALMQGGEIEAAMSAFDRSLAGNSNQPETLCNRGTGRLALGDFQGALTDFERALALKPGFAGAARNMLNAALFDHAATPAQRFDLHKRAMAALAPNVLPPRPKTDRTPDRVLRVGYLSSDFRGHPVARNFLPLFKAHRSEDVSLFCYADVVRPDSVTREFAAKAKEFRNIAGTDDRAVTEMIRADRIDILVFLAGRFDRNRPEIAWHRPAPILVSMHDCATSGIPVMDYIVADRHLAPKSTSEMFTERPLRLPGFYLHEVIENSPEPGEMPLRRNGFITFGCFNNPAKLTDATFALWACAMNAVPDARLLLKYKRLYGDTRLCDRVRERLRVAGVDPSRIEFVSGIDDLAHHLELYRRVDIALDVQPFSGSTTSFEALWMGVPVMTINAATMVGRWTLAMERTLGAHELVAADLPAFGQLARRLASDPAYLAEFRRDTRNRIRRSPLCNVGAKARQLERLYRAIWRNHCRTPE